MRVSEPFSPLIVALMVFTSTNQKQYRVYSSQDEFVVVDAETASEAILISGIEKPLKLFHIIPNMEAILKDSQLRILKQPDPEPEAVEADESGSGIAEPQAASAGETADAEAIIEASPAEERIEEIAVAAEEAPESEATTTEAHAESSTEETQSS